MTKEKGLYLGSFKILNKSIDRAAFFDVRDRLRNYLIKGGKGAEFITKINEHEGRVDIFANLGYDDYVGSLSKVLQGFATSNSPDRKGRKHLSIDLQFEPAEIMEPKQESLKEKRSLEDRIKFLEGQVAERERELKSRAMEMDTLRTTYQKDTAAYQRKLQTAGAYNAKLHQEAENCRKLTEPFESPVNKAENKNLLFSLACIVFTHGADDPFSGMNTLFREYATAQQKLTNARVVIETATKAIDRDYKAAEDAFLQQIFNPEHFKDIVLFNGSYGEAKNMLKDKAALLKGNPEILNLLPQQAREDAEQAWNQATKTVEEYEQKPKVEIPVLYVGTRNSVQRFYIPIKTPVSKQIKDYLTAAAEQVTNQRIDGGLETQDDHYGVLRIERVLPKPSLLIELFQQMFRAGCEARSNATLKIYQINLEDALAAAPLSTMAEQTPSDTLQEYVDGRIRQLGYEAQREGTSPLRQFCKAKGIGVNTIYLVATGRQYPSEGKCQWLADLLDVPVGEINKRITQKP
ncbi:hypothetical protein HZB02_06255 [Candidatus Woesearchaeota archaeon]|nr:hypothetical protein [Candidatus Woesearchaeota archaeon]